MKSNNRTYTNILVPLLFVLCMGIQCTNREKEFAQDNPFDPGGTHWSKNVAPSVTFRSSSKPLWTDFDFQKETGMLPCTLQVSDKNGKYDTVRTVVVLGTSATTLDTIFSWRSIVLDTIFTLTNLIPGTTYYYTCNATDTWDTTSIVSGEYITPGSPPPPEVDSICATPASSYVHLAWYGKNSNTRYRVYRSLAKEGPFTVILDTTVAGLSPTFEDYVSDYRIYYYTVSSINSFGECRSKKVVTGYRYSTSISAPSSVAASDGGYANLIYVSWSSVSYAKKYYIHRGRTPADAYAIIDSTTQTYYRDTMRDTSTGFYYRISAANSYGQRSAPSSTYNYGYITGLSYPSTVSASDGSNYYHIIVSWYTVYGAAGYNIYRSLSSSGTYSLIGTSTSTNYYDSVKTMDTYYYKVSAYDQYGREGTLSGYNSGYLSAGLSPPSSISISKGTFENYIYLSWSAASNAAGYYLYRSTSTSLDNFVVIDTLTTTTYNDSVLTDDTYYYTIATYDSLGRISRMSSTGYGSLAKLSTPSITSISIGTSYTIVSINWSSVTGASGYYIYRSDNGSSGQYICIDSTPQTSYNDSTLTDTKTYYYKIAAYNTRGKISALSSYSWGYLKPIGYPTNITTSKLLYRNRIDITWDSIPLATGYNIYRSAGTLSSSFQKIATLTQTHFSDTGLSSQYYYYKISTLKETTESSLSSYIAGSTLYPPLNFTALGSATCITLTWGTISGYAGYYLYRSSDSSTTFQRLAAIQSGVISSYVDSVSDTRTYYYKMSSYSAKDESDKTTIQSAQKQ